MSAGPDSLSAAAVAPLKGPASIHRDWALRGLPETGWILVTDKVQCAACPAASEVKPCVEACAVTHGMSLSARNALGACAQCEPAPCEEACPADAITHTEQGVVVVDQELCLGCRFCVDACEAGALLWVDPYATATPPTGLPEYSAGQPTGKLPNTVAKCTLCSTKLMSGELSVCAVACPSGAVWVGNLDRDTATNGRQVVRLSSLMENRRCEIAQPGRRVVALAG